MDQMECTIIGEKMKWDRYCVYVLSLRNKLPETMA